MKNTLLLVFIHGFKGSDNTFANVRSPDAFSVHFTDDQCSSPKTSEFS